MRVVWTWAGQLAADRRGGAALEFALVGPLLVALCIFVVEVTGLILDYRRVAIAAEAGAEAAEVYADYAVEDIETAAANAFGARGAQNMQVAVSCVEGSGASHRGLLTIEVLYSLPTSLFTADTFTMAAKSVRSVRDCGNHTGS